MKEYKKPRPAGGTAGAGRTETAAYDGTVISTSNFSMGGALSQPSGRIFSILPEGEENALPASDLARLAGFKNQRSMRSVVDYERTQGLPVLASEAGYYRPAAGARGVAEIRRFLRRQDARAISNRRATRLLRARLRELEKAPLDGQITFEEWG